MVDVVANAIAILQVFADIRDVVEDIQEHCKQALTLSKRVAAIEPTVLAVRRGQKRLTSKALNELFETLNNITLFLKEYKRMSILTRVWRRRSNSDKFGEFKEGLLAWTQALHLDIAVGLWNEQHDAADRLEDIETLTIATTREERTSTESRAKYREAKEDLAGAARSELQKLWVEIDFDKDLDFEDSIGLGSGGFGEVKTARWNGSEVAVKHLREHDNRSLVDAIRKEIRNHSSLHFDHVVQLYAASTVAPNFCMVMEYASEGSLFQYLYSQREPREPLEHALQAAFMLDIAKGMKFLHSKGVWHRDLKSANVLVFANRRLKLCDFGLSKMKAESSSGSSVVGTPQWMSPEVLKGGKDYRLADVYSFGVVCFEVATRMKPFQGMQPAQVTVAVILDKQRPQVPAGASASPDIVSLMERCWKQEKVQRPDGFAHVVQELAAVVRRVGDPRSASARSRAAEQERRQRQRHPRQQRRGSPDPAGPHSPPAQRVNSSLGVKNRGTASVTSTAPLTFSGSLGASVRRAPARNPKAAPVPAPPAHDASSDRSALMALYEATEGPGWKGKEGWGTFRPVGDWCGVTADVEGRVIQLMLERNNLKGSIPKELGALGKLKHLSLRGNELTGPIPPELGKLAALKVLLLFKNQLSGPIPPEVGKLAALTLLSLWGNRLTGAIPSQFGALDKLVKLDLSFNKLSGPIPSELGHLSALKDLYLYNNQLSGHIAPELGKLGALQELHLAGNRLSGPVPPELGNLLALQELSLSWNKLSGPIPPAIGNLGALLHLGLEGNELSGPIPKEIGRLTSLTTLDLGDTQLRGAWNGGGVGGC